MEKERNIDNDLSINENRLDLEMLDQPSRFYYWSSLACRASRDRRRQRLRLREVQAQKTREWKDLHVGVRLTDKQMEAILLKDPDFLTEEMKLIQAEYLEDQLLNARDAFKQRHQVIIELNKMRNEEKYFGKNMYNEMAKDFERRQEEKDQ